MVHDFMKPQPIIADVYMMRFIPHDWSDKYSIKILKNIAKATEGKPGSRLVVLETVIPEPNTVTSVQEKIQRYVAWWNICRRRLYTGESDANFLIRSIDLQMVTLVNSAERTLDDWKTLFTRVDERLQVVSVTKAEDSAGSIIIGTQIGWPGSKSTRSHVSDGVVMYMHLT